MNGSFAGDMGSSSHAHKHASKWSTLRRVLLRPAIARPCGCKQTPPFQPCPFENSCPKVRPGCCSKVPGHRTPPTRAQTLKPIKNPTETVRNTKRNLREGPAPNRPTTSTIRPKASPERAAKGPEARSSDPDSRLIVGERSKPAPLTSGIPGRHPPTYWRRTHVVRNCPGICGGDGKTPMDKPGF